MESSLLTVNSQDDPSTLEGQYNALLIETRQMIAYHKG